MIKQSGDGILFVERGIVAAQFKAQDSFKETCVQAMLEKFKSPTRELVLSSGEKPYEVLYGEQGNLLVTVGAQILWDKLIGAAGTVFDNANAYIGVGDSNTAAAIGQTDLQAAANKFREPMDATYPQRSTNTCIFRSSFEDADANFAWAEWAIFNASSAGVMLNRKVESFGTKASGTWTLTLTLSLA